MRSDRPPTSVGRRRILTLSVLLVVVPALFVAAGSPGPRIAVLVARMLTHGLRDVLPFLVAMWLGEALWLTVAVTVPRWWPRPSTACSWR